MTCIHKLFYIADADTTSHSVGGINENIDHEAFWHWNSFAKYVYVKIVLSLAMLAINLTLGHYESYRMLLGTISAAIEVCIFTHYYVLL